MVETAALVIFIIGISFVIIVSLLGKIHLSLLFLVPLFPLRNVVERMYQFPLGKDMMDIILVAMIAGWIVWAIAHRERGR